MSRVIHTESGTRTRSRLLQSIAVALGGLAAGGLSEHERRDRLAYTLLALESIARSVESTADAWEKRGYWLKVDKFRAEWNWIRAPQTELRTAIQAEDWVRAEQSTASVLLRLASLPVPTQRRRAKPWQDAYKRLHESETRG